MTVRYPGRVEQVLACSAAHGLAFLQDGTDIPLRGRRSRPEALKR